MIKYLCFVGGLLFTVGIQAQCPSLTPTTLPFTEDFESYTGTVEPSANDSVFNCSSTYKWDFHRAGSSGRLSFATTAYTGSQSAVMDATSGYDTNYTTLTVNLSSYSASSDNIVLSFYYRENGDEALEPADRVWIRGSSTDSYIEILDWNAQGNGSTWTLGRFKMDSILTANSQSFSSTTQIRWGQSDNTAWSGPDGFAFDDVSIVELTCPQPSGLTATNSGTSINVNWTTGGASAWQVSYGLSGSSPGQNITNVTGSLPFTITGLSRGVTYDVYVRDSCAAGDVSFWTGPVSVSVPYLPPYLEDWSNGFPNDWTEAQGLISDSTVFTSTSSSWTNGSFNAAGSASARINIYGTTPDEWLISPSIDLGTGTTYQLNFQAGLTQWNSSSSSTLGVDDTVKVVISTDNGITWSDTNTLIALSSADAISNGNGSYYAVSLAGYSGVVKLAFYAESTVSNADNDFYVDDIEIRVPPACPKPTALSDSNITTSSIDLTWQSGGSGPWYIHWGPCGFNQGSITHIDTATSMPYTLSGLNPGTSYEYRLIEHCGSDFSDTVNGGCFNTLCTVQTLPYSEDFNMDLGCFTVLDSGSTSDTWMQVSDYSGSQLDGTGFAFADSDGAGSGTSMDEYLVSPVVDASGLTGSLIMDFDQYFNELGDNADVEVWDGSQWVTVLAQSGADVGSFANPDHQSIDISAYANANLQVRFHYYNANWAYYWAVDNFELKEVQCLESSNLSAYAFGADSIAINWTAGGGSSFGIEYGTSGFTPGTGSFVTTTDTFAVFGSLTSQTAYDFYLTDTCTAGNSVTIGPLTVSTLCNAPSPVTLPWVENFESYSGTYRDFTNFCHTDYNLTYSNTDTVARLRMNTGTGYPNGGTVAATLDRDPSGGVESNFLTFTLDLSNYTTSPGILLEFYYQHHGEENHANDRVWVRGSDTSAWVEVYNLYANQGPTSTYNQVAVDILTMLAASGQNVGPTTQIRFGQQDDFPSTSLTVSDGYTFDDISLTELTCGLTSNLDTGLILPTSAVLKWTSNGSLWNIAWGPQGFGQGSQSAGGYIIKGVSSNPYTLANLSADSCYDFYVQDTCIGVGAGAWAGPYTFCTPPTCFQPTSLGVDANTLTSASADLYWTAGGAPDFNVEYGPLGFGRGSGTLLNVNNDTLNVSGLSSNTCYEFYVRDSCGLGDVSKWAGPYQFCTPCLPQNLPYVENFDVSIGCFTPVDGGTTSDTWYQTQSYNGNSVDGTAFAFVDSDGAGSGNHLSEKLESVQLDASNISNPLVLTFDHYYNNISSDSAIVEVFDGVQWVMVASYTSDQGSWTAPASDSLDISAYANAALQIRFRYEDDNVWAWYWAVDNVKVYEISSCAAPTNIGANALGCDTVEVSWISGVNTTSSTIVYGAKGFAPPAGTVVTNATSPYIITGLTMNTEYEIYVVDSCSGDVSFPVGPVAVKTDSVGPVMASFTSIQSDTTANDATVDFDASASTGDGLTYDWDFGNGSTGTGVNASGTYTSNGTVSVKLTVTDRCGNTDDTTITVVVSHISISENLYNVGIDVYPNPSNGNFKVNISGGNSAYTIEVTDLSGKMVYKNANLKGGEEQEVNLGNVASGVYLIRISGDGLNATQRMMID